MKKIVLMALLFGVLTAFITNNYPAEDTVTAKALHGYRLRDTNISLTDYNLWVITTVDVFDKTFVPEQEGTIPPNFGEELVLAAKVQTWANVYKLRVKKVVTRNDELNFYFSIEKGKADPGVYLTTYPKNKSIRKVNFYHDDMLVRSVPIVNVY